MFLNRRPIQFRLLFLITMVLAVVLLASTGSSWIGTAAAQTVPSVTPEGTLPPPTPVPTPTPTPTPPPAPIWPWTICGGVGVLALILLFIWLRRRRGEETEEVLPPV